MTASNEPQLDHQPRQAPDWHAIGVEAVLAQLEASETGLANNEAERRLRKHGPNALDTAKSEPAWRRLLRQFDNVLIYVLLAAALISSLLGHVTDALVILLVVLANAIFGFFQEGRAEQALESIRAMIAPMASVIRAGQRRTISGDQVVPGDIVILEAGDRVPADLRLLRARNLRIDEAILTGESVAAEKSVTAVAAAAGLGDRDCVAFSGTMVAAGQGLGVAVATGGRTEIGRISALLAKVELLETPLVQQMNRFGRLLTAVTLLVSALVFALAVLVHHSPIAEAFMAVVGLAVAAIPEGLPAVMTITLAIGVQRMAARQAIIRRLPAVETLGSVSIICSDKTGTLTKNEMTVSTLVLARELLEVQGIGYEPKGGFVRGAELVDPTVEPGLQAMALAMLLCNDATMRSVEAGWVVDGDPMEGALLSMAMKAGLEPESTRKRWARVDELPFDARERFMATLHHDHAGNHVILAKGAPERIVQMCRAQLDGDRECPLQITHWQEAVERMAAQGQRVLALARQAAPADLRELEIGRIDRGFVLLGLVGLIDPPREEALLAVRECRSAGITVKMITGDHLLTAKAIAGSLGLADDIVAVTGQDLEGLDERALDKLARSATVFARTSPEHKLRLVKSLQRDGSVVAMTGDGVNDAPALKRADVGVAMGKKGTEAAKEAAGMVLADDNFASIVAAVHEGRTVYDNLKKLIAWTLPTNGGEALIVIGAMLLGLTLPISPLQILWINMVTDTSLGLTLAFEPAEAGVMRRPPRKRAEPILSGVIVWRTVFVSILYAFAAFAMFHWVQERTGSIETARTAVVATIVVLEISYLFSVRYMDEPSLTWLGVRGTPAVLLGIAITTLAQLLFTYFPPMQAIFETTALDATEIAAIVVVGVAAFAILEVEKLLRRRCWLALNRSRS